MQLTLEGEPVEPSKLVWVDYTRRNDPSTLFWAERLKTCLAEQGYPRVFCFWTKAPGAVALHYKKVIKDMQDHGTLVLGQVTYNGYKELEPGITEERANLGPFVDLLGADHIRLRFDPIIIGYTKLDHFKRCLGGAVEYGIKRIMVNYLILEYKDVRATLKPFGITREATRDEKVKMLRAFVDRAKEDEVEVGCCAELMREGIHEEVPELVATGCADMGWAVALKPELKGVFKKRASRPGCQCCYSDDWGLYASRGGPKCVHQCKYCYAK